MKSEDVEKYINDEMQGEDLEHFESELDSNGEISDVIVSTKSLIHQLKQKGFIQRISLARPNKPINTKRYKVWFALTLILATFFCLFMILRKEESQPTNPNQNKIENSILKDNSIIIQEPYSIKDTVILKPQNIEKKDTKVEVKPVPMAILQKDDFWQKNKQLALNIYSTPKQLEILRGSEVLSVLDSAKLALNNENYGLTLKLVDKISDTKVDVNYFKAIVYFNTGEYKTADTYFQKVTSQNSAILDEIEWYQTLNALACGTKCFDQFNNYLNKILAKTNHPFHRQAIIISNKIKENR